ncbi:uncharacterized protein CANTADRAFT_22606 [Suhomyces tanzawaensis NRRL Y-17324]|uniref:Uncharacterized protein n=1 Tax=Suhomyces tanzawaensis NRRL Y-17324 TaxID=984487 RepID=A0A1E4SGJ8_9ASCO|nr:uncharacterized protein CANTADRAFT_22606 [Suhomyces tanzawaensis NRRL Y-17324]ODV78633.1 hypothetical protein CANTADRAFT_22606 [Suhomyces tanzawaensis NRRL Y-17324]
MTLLGSLVTFDAHVSFYGVDSEVFWQPLILLTASHPLVCSILSLVLTYPVFFVKNLYVTLQLAVDIKVVYFLWCSNFIQEVARYSPVEIFISVPSLPCILAYKEEWTFCNTRDVPDGINCQQDPLQLTVIFVDRKSRTQLSVSAVKMRYSGNSAGHRVNELFDGVRKTLKTGSMVRVLSR